MRRVKDIVNKKTPFFDHLNKKSYFPETIRTACHTQIKALFEIDLSTVDPSDDITKQVNKIIFKTDEFILNNANLNIINFHQRIHSSPGTFFIYITTNTENMSLVSISEQKAIDLFFSLSR